MFRMCIQDRVRMENQISARRSCWGSEHPERRWHSAGSCCVLGGELLPGCWWWHNSPLSLG